ncbi:unnamed protein product [Rotaria sp. Silwood1]|nr:unnamed protein product [Rotaria sp. Silwood1]CAF4814193.1 unnamed protein product [Rotaria sp. Silwood1]
MSGELESPSKRPKFETLNSHPVPNTLPETSLLQQVRRRSFSHWPHRTSPSNVQMIEAGFFSCNIGDRVICIYCNLICQQWTPDTDDPCEVHKTISYNCIYVKANLIRPVPSPMININENSTELTSNHRSSASNNLGSLQSNDGVFVGSCNPAYSDASKRHPSFATWPNEDLPLVDDLVRAGFFYTGTNTIVTCFYCNGSLQSLGSNDNPLIEHARRFPHCAYARQLCGEDLYRKIQESQRTQQEERTGSNDIPNTNLTTKSQQISTLDDRTLSRLVADRLDLTISKRLLNQNFKLSIIKRCWENQLKIKGDDFVSEYDLYIACLILQKQIEQINTKKENIIIPSVKIKQIREQARRILHVFDRKEAIEKTIIREYSFIDWPSTLPARLQMITGGWCSNRAKGRDYTMCLYCGVERNNWNYNDNPRNIHQELSPNCPFILSPHPIESSSVPIKLLHEIFTQETITYYLSQPNSPVLLKSDSTYSLPPNRYASFFNFPGGTPKNIEELILLMIVVGV